MNENHSESDVAHAKFLLLMDEYEREMCPWGDVEYLHKCAERYGMVGQPTHLHCLAVALSNKLKDTTERLEALDNLTKMAQEDGLYDDPPGARVDDERDALADDVFRWLKGDTENPLKDAEELLWAVHTYLTGGEK